jgi:hypothetical protein
MDTTKSTACVITLWFLDVVYWNNESTLTVGAASAGGEWYCEDAVGRRNRKTAMNFAIVSRFRGFM